MSKFSEKLTKIITDPIIGPFEGEDFWIDDNGTIQVAENNVKMAATIMRKTNASGKFKQRLSLIHI